MVVMCLSVTDLPLTVCIVWVYSNHSNTHGTIHARAFAIEALPGLIRELTSICGFAVTTAMHVALVQHAFGILLASSAHEFIAMLQRP
jgi:hypothetical protein